jgi:hypothetical protein
MSNKGESIVGKLVVEVDTSAIDHAIERANLLMLGVMRLNESISQLGPRLGAVNGNPVPSELAGMIAQQKRTNELLEALLRAATSDGLLTCSA